MFCFFNNGHSMRTVEPGYVAQSGEVLFLSCPTTGQLNSAFTGYATQATAQSTLMQIEALEASITLPMMSEAFLGSNAVISNAGSPYNGMTAAQAIASIQTEIATLRGQM